MTRSPSWGTHAGAPDERRLERSRHLGAFLTASALVVVIVTAAAVRLVRGDGPVAGPIAASPAPAGTPAGYTDYIDRADDFSLAVPSAWYDVDPSTVSSDDAEVRTLEAANPYLHRPLATPGAGLGPDYKFGAYDDELSGGWRPRVFVEVVPVGRAASDLVGLAAAVREHYGAALVGTPARLSLGGRPALSATLRLRLSPAGRQEVTVAYYFLSGGRRMYVLSLGGVDDPVAASIVRTFDVL